MVIRCNRDYYIPAIAIILFFIICWLPNKGSYLSQDLVFFGDSITQMTMGDDIANKMPSLAVLMNKKVFIINKGQPGWDTNNAINDLPNWINYYSGDYIIISFGTNDAKNCKPEIFYNNYSLMIQTVFNSHKIPIIPLISWSALPLYQNCIPQLNEKIEQLYKKYPQIIKGPDLYSIFYNHPEWLYPDQIHPNPIGIGIYRQAWAKILLQINFRLFE